MIDKTCDLKSVYNYFSDGLSIMVGGFGVPGTPFTLIDSLLAHGARELTIIKNEANEDGMGVSKLIEAGRVKKIITTHLGLNRTVIAMMNQQKVAVEFYPQGILAEKIRAGGAGLFGFLTDIGIDTIIKNDKKIIEFGGRELIVEPSLRADLALIHAARGDRFGNLIYEKSANNFNHVMATAGERVIAEVEELVEIGGLEPGRIHTPGAFVDHVVPLNELTSEYGILQNHVL